MNKNTLNIFNRLKSEEPYWAYTGSVALLLHNKNKGFSPRSPQNIDIIVDPQWRSDRKSTRLNSSHVSESRMPSSA